MDAYGKDQYYRPPRSPWCAGCFIVSLSIIVVGVIAAPLLLLAPGRPVYSVAIDAVASLDLGRPALDPAFNLTVALTSHRLFGGGSCGHDGLYVEVAYRCVPLAASGRLVRRLCAAAGRASAEPVAARGTGVRLPGYLVDSLAADMRGGELEFEVTIRRSGGDEGGATEVALSGARRVGDAAALSTICGGYSSDSCGDQGRRGTGGGTA